MRCGAVSSSGRRVSNTKSESKFSGVHDAVAHDSSIGAESPSLSSRSNSNPGDVEGETSSKHLIFAPACPQPAIAAKKPRLRRSKSFSDDFKGIVQSGVSKISGSTRRTLTSVSNAEQQRLAAASAGKDRHALSQAHTVLLSCCEMRAQLPPEEINRLFVCSNWDHMDFLDDGQFTTRCKQYYSSALRFLFLFLRRLRCKTIHLGFFLRILSLTSIFWAPVQLAMEPFCESPGERSTAALGKALHLAFSLVYTLLSSLLVFAELMLYESSLPAGNEDMAKFRRRGGELWTVLILDAIAGIGIFGEVSNLYERPFGEANANQWIILLGVVRLWRWVVPTVETRTERLGFWAQVIELLICLCMVTHLGACALGAIAAHGVRMNKTTWADDSLRPEGGGPLSCVAFYMSALYFSAYTVTSIGYGDLSAGNTAEQGFLALFMIVSQMYCAKIFADLTFIVSTYNYWRAEHHQIVTRTTDALRCMGVPPCLQERVKAYQHFAMDVQKENYAHECLRNLSQPLRDELQLVRYSHLVTSAQFLQNIDVKVIRYIVSSFTDSIYLPADFIMRKGEEGKELYFLRQGNAGVFVNDDAPCWDDTELRLMKRGDFFGEVALITDGPRSAWIMARLYCMCSVLHKKVIDDLMQSDPSCVASLVRSMKRSLNLEPQVTWIDIAARLRKRLSSLDELRAIATAHSPGDVDDPTYGMVTWDRYQKLMKLLKVSILDLRLHWIDVDKEEAGSVDFDSFVSVIELYLSEPLWKVPADLDLSCPVVAVPSASQDDNKLPLSPILPGSAGEGAMPQRIFSAASHESQQSKAESTSRARTDSDTNATLQHLQIQVADIEKHLCGMPDLIVNRLWQKARKDSSAETSPTTLRNGSSKNSDDDGGAPPDIGEQNSGFKNTSPVSASSHKSKSRMSLPTLHIGMHRSPANSQPCSPRRTSAGTGSQIVSAAASFAGAISHVWSQPKHSVEEPLSDPEAECSPT